MPRGRRPNPFNTVEATRQRDASPLITRSLRGRVRFARLSPWAGQRIVTGADGNATVTNINNTVDLQLINTRTGANPQRVPLFPQPEPPAEEPVEGLPERRRRPRRPRAAAAVEEAANVVAEPVEAEPMEVAVAPVEVAPVEAVAPLVPEREPQGEAATQTEVTADREAVDYFIKNLKQMLTRRGFKNASKDLGTPGQNRLRTAEELMANVYSIIGNVIPKAKKNVKSTQTTAQIDEDTVITSPPSTSGRPSPPEEEEAAEPTTPPATRSSPRRRPRSSSSSASRVRAAKRPRLESTTATATPQPHASPEASSSRASRTTPSSPVPSTSRDTSQSFVMELTPGPSHAPTTSSHDTIVLEPSPGPSHAPQIDLDTIVVEPSPGPSHEPPRIDLDTPTDELRVRAYVQRVYELLTGPPRVPDDSSDDSSP